MISIITLHDICNPGSVYQAYALNKFIRDCGYDCNVIDYVPSYSYVGNRKIRGIVKNILFGRIQKRIKQKYKNFISKNIKLTEKKYCKYVELLKNQPKADLYIAGSDQLWNRAYDCGNDEAFYLSFIQNTAKISYATSLGKKDVSKEDLSFISERIRDYKYLSVREKSGCSMLEEFLGRPVQWVCDPVFLLNKEEYEKFATPRMEEKYIVIYLSAASRLLESVIVYAKLQGYKVVLLGGNITRCSCDIHIKDMGPEDFISYLIYADVIISSSFHATAFSHIFEKKFGVILPQGNGERIESLLSLSSLQNQVIKSDLDIANAFKEIDYSNALDRLSPFIESSKVYLTDAIKNVLG